MFSCNSSAQSDFDKKLNFLLSGTVPQIHVNELKSKMNEKDSLILLDARTKEEYGVSKIDAAKYVGYDDFDAATMKDIPKDQQIVVYCSVGYRSEKIGEKLIDLGYANVLNLYGGIFDWKNKDNAVINMKGQETDSVHAYNRIWSIWLNKGVKVYD